jgi:hypothetical protein
MSREKSIQLPEIILQLKVEVLMDSNGPEMSAVLEPRRALTTGATVPLFISKAEIEGHQNDRATGSTMSLEILQHIACSWTKVVRKRYTGDVRPCNPSATRHGRSGCQHGKNGSLASNERQALTV